jgi:phosphoglycerol transferase
VRCARLEHGWLYAIPPVSAFSEGVDSIGQKAAYRASGSTKPAFMSGRSSVLYVSTAVLACVAAFFVMHLWQLHPGIPLYYSHGGDELVMLAWTKALVDDGWYQNVTHLGAPFGMSFGDFPIPNLLHMLALRMLTLFIHNPATALNLYYLAGFPIIALASAYVLRRFGVSWATASIVSVIYAFLPTRFMRNESHLFYAQYYLAPVLVLSVVWAARGHGLFDPDTKRPTRDGWIYLAGLFTVSWDNEYFAIFGMLFLAVAAIASAIRVRHIRGVIAGVAGIVVLVVGIELELLPYTIYQHQHGADSAAIVRPPQASEVYALTLAQLVLPIQAHRIHRFAAKRAYFDAGLPMLVNENSSASLGALGALGFLGSLGALLLVRRMDRSELWPDLAKLNLAAFLLTTIGGVGAIISYFFVPDLRAYNRVSPIIGFASLASVAFALEYGRRRWLTRPSLDRAWYAGLLIVMVLAILDQTSVNYVPDYASDREAFLSEGAYANRLEQRLPKGSAIYQIPHVLFPEGPPVDQLGSWDQAALYLHTHQLRYSFGATRGRALDAWEQQTDGLPAASFVTHVMLAGFDGIAVYRSGYADGGKAVTDALNATIGTPPFVRDDGSISTFDLSGLRATYRNAIGAVRADRIAGAVIAPNVSISFGDGFYGVETASGRQWNWAPARASIDLVNTSDVEQSVRLRVLLASATSLPAHLTMRAPSGTTTVHSITSKPVWLTYNFMAPPGPSQVRFETDAPRLTTPGDTRDLRFQVLDATIAPSDVAAASDIVARLLSRTSLHALPQIGVEFGSGCYAEESSPTRTWHWCGNAADLILHNTSHTAQAALLQYDLVTSAPADVTASVLGSRSVLRATPEGEAIDERVEVPPGTTVIHLATKAAPLVAPGDARRMVLQIANLHLSEARADRKTVNSY